MFSIPVRVAMFAVVLATIVAAAAQPSYAAPLSQTETRVLCVNIDGGVTGAPCSNADAYPTIQAAVDAAQSGDEIRIAKGIYTSADPRVVHTRDKSLSLVGGFTAGNWTTPGTASDTVIDGQDQRQGITAFNNETGRTLHLAHLTIQNCVSGTLDSFNTGGGVDALNVSVSFFDVVLQNNAASGSGGGAAVLGGMATLEQTVFVNNTAGEDGGGLYAGRVQIVDSVFSNNAAQRSGGGLAAVTQGTIERTVVDNNTALFGSGGGIRLGGESRQESSFVLREVAVVDNMAGEEGGGVVYDGSTVPFTIVASLIGGNSVARNPEDDILRTYNGGGIRTYGPLRLEQSLVVDNLAQGTGGAIFADAEGPLSFVGSVLGNNRAQTSADGIFVNRRVSPDTQAIEFINVTIASADRTQHAAIQVQNDGATLSLVNTVITNHEVGVARAAGATLTGNYNAFFNNGTNQTVGGAAQSLPFANMVTADPQFVDPAASDVHLRETSPLIDRGDPSRDYANQRDIDGQVVPYGARADIGADEWTRVYSVYVPIVAR